VVDESLVVVVVEGTVVLVDGPEASVVVVVGLSGGPWGEVPLLPGRSVVVVVANVVVGVVATVVVVVVNVVEVVVVVVTESAVSIVSRDG
jgi:hypothetical protein